MKYQACPYYTTRVPIKVEIIQERNITEKKKPKYFPQFSLFEIFDIYRLLNAHNNPAANPQQIDVKTETNLIAKLEQN